MSKDIGAYDTCGQSCVYCYANANKAKALEALRLHDPCSAFLGVSRAHSDLWIKEIRTVNPDLLP